MASGPTEITIMELAELEGKPFELEHIPGSITEHTDRLTAEAGEKLKSAADHKKQAAVAETDRDKKRELEEDKKVFEQLTKDFDELLVAADPRVETNKADLNALKILCEISDRDDLVAQEIKLESNETYNAYRQRIGKLTTFVSEFVPYAEKDRGLLTVLSITVEAIKTGQFGQDLEARLDNLNISDAQKASLKEAIREAQAQLKDTSVSKFATACGADPKEQHLNDNRAFSKLVRAFDALLPEKPAFSWEKSVEVPKNTYAGWADRVRQNGFAEEDWVDQTVHRRIPNTKKPGNLMRIEAGQARHQDEKGMRTLRNIQTATLETRVSVWESEWQGIPTGTAIEKKGKKKDRVKTYTIGVKRINSIIEAHEEYLRLTGGAENDDMPNELITLNDGRVLVPTLVYRNGQYKESWEAWEPDELEAWKITVKNVKESWEAAGFKYNVEKERAKSKGEKASELRMKLDENVDAASNWIDRVRAANTLRDIYEAQIEGAFNNSDFYLAGELENTLAHFELLADSELYAHGNRAYYLKWATQQALVASNYALEQSSPEFKLLVKQNMELIIALQEKKQELLMRLASEINTLNTTMDQRAALNPTLMTLANTFRHQVFAEAQELGILTSEDLAALKKAEDLVNSTGQTTRQQANALVRAEEATIHSRGEGQWADASGRSGRYQEIVEKVITDPDSVTMSQERKNIMAKIHSVMGLRAEYIANPDKLFNEIQGTAQLSLVGAAREALKKCNSLTGLPDNSTEEVARLKLALKVLRSKEFAAQSAELGKVLRREDGRGGDLETNVYQQVLRVEAAINGSFLRAQNQEQISTIA